MKQGLQLIPFCAHLIKKKKKNDLLTHTRGILFSLFPSLWHVPLSRLYQRGVCTCVPREITASLRTRVIAYFSFFHSSFSHTHNKHRALNKHRRLSVNACCMNLHECLGLLLLHNKDSDNTQARLSRKTSSLSFQTNPDHIKKMPTQRRLLAASKREWHSWTEKGGTGVFWF